jgi:DNA-binding NtrC family response regulator
MQHPVRTPRQTSPAAAGISLRTSVEQLRELLGPECDPDQAGVIAASMTMQELLQQVRCFATSSAAVLITGESGSGKELIARLLHQWSDRRHRPYVRVNCAALADSLVESELFGHERGAFTGAEQQRVGRLEYAGDGTILLDEISEIPIGLQAKLLRVLEEEEFQRVGSNTTQMLQARIVATSNRDLQQAMENGQFRSDLYYRLNILQIDIPPLRDRPEDILPLAEYFVGKYQHESRFPLAGIASAAARHLLAYSWPGNVRQLRNAIRRACIVSRGPLLDVADFPPLDGAPRSEPIDWTHLSLEDVERQVIVSHLRRSQGNKSRAAETLGVTARTLANKVKRYRQLGYL